MPYTLKEVKQIIDRNLKEIKSINIGQKQKEILKDNAVKTIEKNDFLLKIEKMIQTAKEKKKDNPFTISYIIKCCEKEEEIKKEEMAFQKKQQELLEKYKLKYGEHISRRIENIIEEDDLSVIRQLEDIPITSLNSYNEIAIERIEEILGISFEELVKMNGFIEYNVNNQRENLWNKSMLKFVFENYLGKKSIKQEKKEAFVLSVLKEKSSLNIYQNADNLSEFYIHLERELERELQEERKKIKKTIQNIILDKSMYKQKRKRIKEAKETLQILMGEKEFVGFLPVYNLERIV